LYSVTSFLLTHATAGLLALLGLAVPVAIHLWNRRPGRTVQVGSVRWLAATANRRLRNLRLEQFWLLVLRAAVLTLLALAVAGPLWLRFQSSRAPRGMVLLAPETLRPEVLPAVRASIDSLRGQGFTLRLFAPGFPVVSSQTWGNTDSLAKLASARLPLATASAPDDYWARARQAADSFPTQPLRIVAGTASLHFAGPRPALPARLTWQPVPLPDSAVWVASAALVEPATLRLVVGRSTEEATRFRVVSQKAPQTASALMVPGLPGLRYQPAAANQPATVQQPGQLAVPVVTEPLRVLLYADATHAESARFVRAALQAAGIGLAQGLEIRTIDPQTSFTGNAPSWLFWLSEQPVPSSWLAQSKRGTQFWQEASTTGATLETELDVTGLVTAPPILINRLDTLFKLGSGSLVVWQDGTGRPVLTHQPNGAGGLYQLRTRLQPTWSGLPDSPALPELLLHLLRSHSATSTVHDLRQLDARQLTAAVTADTTQTPAANSAIRPSQHTTDLRPWAVLAAMVLFGLERLLAGRRTTVLPSTSSL
jgi:hypothetical protein